MKLQKSVQFFKISYGLQSVELLKWWRVYFGESINHVTYIIFGYLCFWVKYRFFWLFHEKKIFCIVCIWISIWNSQVVLLIIFLVWCASGYSENVHFEILNLVENLLNLPKVIFLNMKNWLISVWILKVLFHSKATNWCRSGLFEDDIKFFYSNSLNVIRLSNQNAIFQISLFVWIILQNLCYLAIVRTPHCPKVLESKSWIYLKKTPSLLC